MQYNYTKKSGTTIRRTDTRHLGRLRRQTHGVCRIYTAGMVCGMMFLGSFFSR